MRSPVDMRLAALSSSPRTTLSSTSTSKRLPDTAPSPSKHCPSTFGHRMSVTSSNSLRRMSILQSGTIPPCAGCGMETSVAECLSESAPFILSFVVEAHGDHLIDHAVRPWLASEREDHLEHPCSSPSWNPCADPRGRELDWFFTSREH